MHDANGVSAAPIPDPNNSNGSNEAMATMLSTWQPAVLIVLFSVFYILKIMQGRPLDERLQTAWAIINAVSGMTLGALQHTGRGSSGDYYTVYSFFLSTWLIVITSYTQTVECRLTLGFLSILGGAAVLAIASCATGRALEVCKECGPLIVVVWTVVMAETVQRLERCRPGGRGNSQVQNPGGVLGGN